MTEEQTVGQVAARFDITIRSLHHYDAIGLLQPSERSYAGYRLYTGDDLQRLQHIVVYRRLGFSLEEVAELLDGGGDVVAHLQRQREAVLTKVADLQGMVAAIDTAMEAQMDNKPVSDAEMREIFGNGFDEEYAVEAEQRWGDTDAWAQSSKRTKGYNKADWEAIKAETDEINARYVALLSVGEPATSEAAMDVAEAARLQIDQRFYTCSREMHAGIAQMYVSDPRFTKTYEDIAPGLAQFVHDAVHANAQRAGGLSAS